MAAPDYRRAQALRSLLRLRETMDSILECGILIGDEIEALEALIAKVAAGEPVELGEIVSIQSRVHQKAEAVIERVRQVVGDID